jgi:PIN domain nuclease of toxin-antitoxin system
VEAVIYLDTHVAFWLYAAAGNARLCSTAEEVVRRADDVRISPMVRLELQYLYEVDRIGEPPAPILDELGSRLGLVVCRADFSAVVHEAERYSWTRDPFDRLIVAQASLHGAPLVTKDGRIHEHYAHAVW